MWRCRRAGDPLERLNGVVNSEAFRYRLDKVLKPRGRPMPRRTALANAARSRVRSAVEPVFARRKGPIRTLADVFVISD